MNQTKNRIIKKMDYIREILSKRDFSNASVLDAGTGKSSAQLLVDLKPKLLTCVSFAGDLRKGKTTEEVLNAAGSKNYKMVYGDIANLNLFSASSFDFILADYLLGELAVSKVSATLQNFFNWLKPGGRLLIVDREFYPKPEIKYEYASMGEIKGDANLAARSDRDIYELNQLFLAIPKEIQLFSEKERDFDYPSEWIQMWLEHIGYKNVVCSVNESEEKLKAEFYKRMEWAKERIERMTNENLRLGLLKEWETVVKEFERRDINDDDDAFARKHFFFEAER